MDASRRISGLGGEILKCHFETLAGEEIMADNQLVNTIDVTTLNNKESLLRVRLQCHLKLPSKMNKALIQ